MSNRRKFLLGAAGLLGTVLGLGGVNSLARPAAQAAQGCDCPCCCCEECNGECRDGCPCCDCCPQGCPEGTDCGGAC